MMGSESVFTAWNLSSSCAKLYLCSGCTFVFRTDCLCPLVVVSQHVIGVQTVWLVPYAQRAGSVNCDTFYVQYL